MLIGDTSTWHPEITEFLDKRKPELRTWNQTPKGKRPYVFEQLLREFSELLQPLLLTGFHGTRLAEKEIASISEDGLRMPDAEMLKKRLADLVHDKLINLDLAAQLSRDPYENTPRSPGELWFFFDSPSIAEEEGLADLFRYWGGEAVYMGADYARKLRSIGTPCIVEADIPMGKLHGSPDNYLIEAYLGNRRSPLLKDDAYAASTDEDIPPAHVRRVIRLTDPDFEKLSGCNGWGEDWLTR